jgi:hypothetical protein
MLDLKLRCIQALVFLGLAIALNLAACSSDDGGSSGPNLCAELGQQTRCMAIYAVPESSSIPLEVDPCWGGAHITLAGFEVYGPDDPAVANLDAHLRTAASAAETESTWRIQSKPRVYWSKEQLLTPPATGDGHLGFPAKQIPPLPEGPVTGGALTNFNTINGVQKSLIHNDFKKTDGHNCDPNNLSEHLPCHVTFARACLDESNPGGCYEEAITNMIATDSTSSDVTAWKLVPVLLPMLNGKCDKPQGSTCPSSPPQYCTERQTQAINSAPVT